MKRSQFIRSAGILILGYNMPSAFAKKINQQNDLKGYLLPLGIDNALKKIAQSISTGSSSKEASTKIINHIVNGNYQVSSYYRNHFLKSVNPIIGNASLNGKGYSGGVYELQKKMNDEGVSANSPVYHMKDHNNFDLNDWRRLCDIADLQNVTDINAQIRTYVKPRDKRMSRYQGEFWVPENLAYILHDPTYYCYGLPTEDPQLHTVGETFQRDIIARTGSHTSVTSFWTQHFFFQGDSACANPAEKEHTIYWGHDEVLKKYYNLSTVKGCGDPASECPGMPSIARPKLRS